MVDIRISDFSEFDSVKEFIHTQWSPNHILATHDTLLKWQHHDKLKNKLNFIVAEDSDTKSIIGILGFIPLSQYDFNLVINSDFWLAIWKIKDGYTGIGAELLNHFVELYNPKSIGSIGINKVVRKLYKILKYKTGKMNQYYLLNPTIQNFKIAEIKNTEISTAKESKYTIREIEDLNTFNKIKHSYHPKKSINYLTDRYANHPVYKYNFYGVFLDTTAKCILVTRKLYINDSSCLRIIDVYGDLQLDSIESELINLLIEEESEYIDCLNYGVSESTFSNLGFSLRGNSVIPNYFEPFSKENIDILIAYKSDIPNYVVFKGDSDQDRPNKIQI